MDKQTLDNKQVDKEQIILSDILLLTQMSNKSPESPICQYCCSELPTTLTSFESQP